MLHSVRTKFTSRSHVILPRRRTAIKFGAIAAGVVLRGRAAQGAKSGRRRWQEFKDFVREVYHRFSEDRVALAAGAISFFTMLSLFPLILLAFSISAPILTELLDNLQSAIGPEIYLFLRDQIFGAIHYRTVSTVVALVVGFWSGSQVFLILESAMNLAWHAQKKRPYWLRRGLAFLMVLIVGSLLGGALLLSNLIRFLAQLQIPLLGYPSRELPWLVPPILSVIIPVLLISALFAIIYRVLPTKRVTFRTVLPGAILAGVLWLASFHVFGWYTIKFALVRYAFLYGSLAGILMLMLWFYYSAFILLLGAEISATYHRRLVEAGDKVERHLEESAQVSVAEREWEHLRARIDNAADSIVYYGYRTED